MTDTPWLDGLISAIPSILIMLVGLAGFIASFVNRARLRGAFGFATAGFLLITLVSLWQTILIAAIIPRIPELVMENHWTYHGVNVFITLTGLGSGFFELVAMALIVAAVFSGRNPAPATPPAPPMPVPPYQPASGNAPQTQAPPTPAVPYQPAPGTPYPATTFASPQQPGPPANPHG